MKILVLAGGFDQIALIQELQSRGHDVILADYLNNPPAKSFVSQHFQISTLDENAVLNLAREEKVDLITTACTDQALLTVARVSKELGTPCYIDDETALKVTNKEYMKQAFINYGIPTAKSKIFNNDGAINKIDFSDFRYPLVVKPCDCNSSKGVKKVEKSSELDTAIVEALKLSRSQKVIIEEFLEGMEISIDVWKDNEDAKILSISTSEKIKNNDNAFTIFKSKYPVSMSEIAMANIKSIARKICAAFKLNNCPVLIQAVLNGDSIDVIEFSARMGGGSKYKLIEYMSGVNIIKTYVSRVLGDDNQIITPKYSNKYLELIYVYAYNGIYKEILGKEALIKNKVINELFVYKEPGSIIEKHTTSSDRVFGFLVQGDTIDELNKKINLAVNKFDISDIHGNSIMIKDIY